MIPIHSNVVPAPLVSVIAAATTVCDCPYVTQIQGLSHVEVWSCKIAAGKHNRVHGASVALQVSDEARNTI